MSNVIEIAIKLKNETASALSKIRSEMKSVSSAIKRATTATADFDKRMVNLNQHVQLYAQVSSAVNQLSQSITAAATAAGIQETAETKLAVVMRQRMNATDDEIQSIYALASAQQEMGVIGDEVILSGAQQISTFLTQKSSIDTLIPAMNNLIAQQKGINATAQDAVNVGNLMGKVMQGQTSALTRVGVTFTDTEQKILKFGTESEKAATLVQVITNNVGDMNASLAKTDAGNAAQLSNTLGDIKEKIGSLLAGIAPYAAIIASGVAFLAQLGQIAIAMSATKAGVIAANIATKAYAVVQAGLNAVMSANPIALVVVAVAALVAAVVMAYHRFDSFRSMCDKTWFGIKRFAAIIKDEVVGRISDFISGIGILGKSIALLFKGDFKASWQAAKDGILSISGAYNPIKSHISEDTKAMKYLGDEVKATTKKISSITGTKVVVKPDMKSLKELDDAIKNATTKRSESKTVSDAKIYQKEIDLLTQKKEKLEQLIGISKKTTGIKTKIASGSIKEIETQLTTLRNKQSRLPIEKAVLLNPDIAKLEAKLKRHKFQIDVGVIKMPKLSSKPSLLNTPVAPDLSLPEIKPIGTMNDNPYEGYLNSLRNVRNSHTQTMESMNAMGNAMNNIGDVVGGAAGGWLQYGANVIQTVSQAIPAIITMMGITTANTAVTQTDTNANVINASSQVLKAYAGIPFVGVALGVAGMAAIIAAMSSVPKFAEGGLAYGPTLGIFGEYSGASNNPEVVAPLNKLKGYIADAGGGNNLGSGHVRFEIEGRKLVGILSKEANKKNRTK